MTRTIRSILLIYLLYTITGCNRTDSFEKLIESNNKFDLAIVNANIIDGTGAPSYKGDILISEEQIAFIGKVNLDKIDVSKTIDANGKIVSPGFIDAHAHASPPYDSSYTNFLANGVTTILIGQDGRQPGILREVVWMNIEAWMDTISILPLELNVATLAGHATLRYLAGVPNDSVASEDQIIVMQSELEKTLELGAFGISTGLEYVPGMYATTEELQALAKVVGADDGIMMSHMRNEDDDVIEASFNELFSLGEFCKVHVSHLKVVYGKGAERGADILRILSEARDRGIRVTADAYPYTASYTGVGILFPSWCKTPEQFEEVKKTRRAELEDFLLKRVIKRNGPEAMLFGSGDYSGKTLADVAKEENRTYVEVLMDLGPFGGSGAHFIMDEELQDVIIADQEIMIASDGSPRILHPRGYGTNARMIERYVLDKGSLMLEQAIYKMTGLPAKTIKLEDRGTLEVGKIADILIFDPNEVQEKATYDDPYQISLGFDNVIINGHLVRESGQFIKFNAGQLLKSN